MLLTVPVGMRLLRDDHHTTLLPIPPPDHGQIIDNETSTHSSCQGFCLANGSWIMPHGVAIALGLTLMRYCAKRSLHGKHPQPVVRLWDVS
jgi:hypothetical protein